MNEKIEQNHIPEGAEIELSVIREPSRNYGFIIAMKGSRTTEEAYAYNKAIEKILKSENLEPHHELSTEAEHAAGTHYWEISKNAGERVTREVLERLLPRIRVEAEELLKK